MVSAVIGPIIGSSLVATVGYRLMFVASGAIRVVAMAIFAALVGRKKRSA